MASSDGPKEYLVKKLNRTVLEYLLHAKSFDAANSLATEGGLTEFSDAACYLETASILNDFTAVINHESASYSFTDEIKANNLKAKVIDSALAWCAQYRTRLQSQ